MFARFRFFAQYDTLLDVLSASNTFYPINFHFLTTLLQRTNTQRRSESTAAINKQILYANLLISIRTFAFRLVILCTIVISRIIKRSVPSSNGPSSSLVIKMPIKTYEGFVLITFMLQKRSALLDTKLLQIAKKIRIPYQMLQFTAILHLFTLHLRVMIRFFSLRL